MKRDVVVKGRGVEIRKKPVDASARIRGIAAKRAAGGKVSDEELADLVLAIAQKLGVEGAGE